MDTTFTVSPLAQIGLLLGFGMTAVGGGGPELRAWAPDGIPASRDTPLLMALRNEQRDYVPGFMLAHADDGGSPEEELHRVASTPSRAVARQMGAFVETLRAAGRSQSADARRITDALEAGERAFAQRIAREMSRFWSAHMASRWNAMRSLMEEDILRRAARTAEHGLAATISSLHSAFSCDSGALRIHNAREWSVFEYKRLVLHPSPMAGTWLLHHDPWGEAGTHLTYPVRSGAEGDPPAENPAATDSLGLVIGQARLVLLSDLGSPRITTELAERHHMSASTVSYHLIRLHRVGLLNRTRDGNRVFYQRTPEADRLVAHQREGHSRPRSDHAVLPPSPRCLTPLL
ncbi:winged helix-turn-helix domain-containing protein [Streptomyces sp. NPDC093568]|uniref:helix-turn-helix domain-containing protein n=1 Tax=Streptomyces sp. NPDC093568 TaxID=3366041 RepID=UPI00381CFABA